MSEPKILSREEWELEVENARLREENKWRMGVKDALEHNAKLVLVTDLEARLLALEAAAREAIDNFEAGDGWRIALKRLRELCQRVEAKPE